MDIIHINLGMKKKTIIAMDVVTSGFGGGGGPFTSTNRIMNSNLKNTYSFEKVFYRKELGSGVSIKRIKDLTKQLRLIKPDIVHFTGLQLSGFHMAIACKLAGIKNTVVTVRGFSGDALYFNPIKKFILSYILEPITLMCSKKVIGVSKYVVSRMVIQLIAGKRSSQIYNFPPEVKGTLPKKDIRSELGIDNRDVIVVTVARITKDKGYHKFDEAILRLKNDKYLKFLIIGDGDYLKTMQCKLHNQVANEQVFFLGYRDDVNQILSACDVFVLPTLHETLSVALLEASQANLALIASDTGGVPEIVENEYNGLLVKPGNIIELVNAIRKVGKNDFLRVNFAKNAKLRIEERFSSDEIVSKLDAVYSSFLK